MLHFWLILVFWHVVMGVVSFIKLDQILRICNVMGVYSMNDSMSIRTYLLRLSERIFSINMEIGSKHNFGNNIFAEQNNNWHLWNIISMSMSCWRKLACFPSYYVIEVIKTIFIVNIALLILYGQSLCDFVPLFTLDKCKRPTKSIIHADVRPHRNVIIRNGVAGCSTNCEWK